MPSTDRGCRTNRGSVLAGAIWPMAGAGAAALQVTTAELVGLEVMFRRVRSGTRDESCIRMSEARSGSTGWRLHTALPSFSSLDLVQSTKAFEQAGVYG